MSDTLETSIASSLPPDLQDQVESLAQLLAELLLRPAPEESTPSHIGVTKPLAPTIAALAGQQIATPQAVIDFGSSNNMQDATVTISGDVAGNNIIKDSTFNISYLTTAPPQVRKLVNDLIIYLEARRVLSHHRLHREQSEYAIQSILNIREKLTTALQDLDDVPEAGPAIREMLDACLKFLDQTEGQKKRTKVIFPLALAELQPVFATNMIRLCHTFKIRPNKLLNDYGDGSWV